MIAALAAVAWAAPPPADRAALILVRCLSYDRALDRRTGELRLALVHPEAAPPPEMVTVLDGLVGVTVGGRPFAWHAEPMTGALPWRERMGHYDAVLLTPGVDPVLAEVAAAARELDVTTLALDPAFVGRGASLGVDQRGTRLQILVDRTEATAEGARLSAELLDRAEVVGG